MATPSTQIILQVAYVYSYNLVMYYVILINFSTLNANEGGLKTQLNFEVFFAN
jgi:hypothetical protein